MTLFLWRCRPVARQHTWYICLPTAGSTKQCMTTPSIPSCPRRLLKDDKPIGILPLGDPSCALLPYTTRVWQWRFYIYNQEQYFSLHPCRSRMVIAGVLGYLKVQLGMLKYSMCWLCCQTNVWTVSWVFLYYFWVVPNHFRYYHRTFGTTSDLAFMLLDIPEVMLMGQLGSGKPISRYSGYMYIWNEPDAVKQVMIPEQKTSEEETN